MDTYEQSLEQLPLVTVIVPVYNPGLFLAPALRSVVAQTYAHWELIVVDDGSTENIETICREFNQIKLIRQERAGVSVARNRGVLNARGDYIAFLDQDDLWKPTKLEAQLAAMQKDDQIGICHTAIQLIAADGAYLSNEITRQSMVIHDFGDTVPKGYDSAGILTPSCVMVKKTALASSGLFDPVLPITGDTDVWLSVCQHYKLVFVESTETCYRLHNNNQSKNHKAGLAELSILYRKYAAYTKRTGDRRGLNVIMRLEKEAPIHLAAQIFDSARNNVRSGKLLTAALQIIQSLRIEPRFVAHSLIQWLNIKTCGSEYKS